MVITRKIEIEVFGTEEEKKNAWVLLRDYHNKIARLNNFVVTEIFLNDLPLHPMVPAITQANE